MERITRKTLLYKSGLGFMCINHAQGCSHGCLYPCYAYAMARSYGRAASLEEWRSPKLVENAEEILARELKRKREKPECVHLCLTTDPFMVGFPEVGEMSCRLISLLNSFGVRASVLTKGEFPEELADEHEYPADNIYGISAISLDEDFRRRGEPGAAPYARRIASLERLHDRGRRTLAHIEPYPSPNILLQDIGKLLDAVGFVDKIFFGRWNYNSLASR
ncbi:MAG: radical SAM protein [Spirochaetaceae bacterium]|nr:radical SAM protein [Spirochaetaceae bacterium]